MFSAEQAKESGLIDRVAYEDEWRGELKKELAADELALEPNYGKAKSAGPAGMAGMMQFMEMLMGRETATRSSKASKIAVVYAVGPIMTGESSTTLFGGSTVGSDTIVKALRDAKADAKVKAIVIRVDSPGGSALASDLIWRETIKSEKPIVVSMGDIAASGGYYISMGAKKIFAEPGTLTGSIGVVSGKLALRGLFDKIGLGAESVKRGANSGVLSFTDPFTDAERQAMKGLMVDIYKQFTTKAAEGRKMDLAKLETLAAGRLFSGRMAVQVGLADQLGTLEDAVAEAKSMGGLKADEEVDLLILPKPKPIFEQLLGVSSIESEIRSVAPELVDVARHAATLQKLFAEPTVTIMPFLIRVR
jgi:protease-4